MNVWIDAIMAQPAIDRVALLCIATMILLVTWLTAAVVSGIILCIKKDKT